MTLIVNTSQLLTMRDSDLGIIENGVVAIENGKIVWVGPASEIRGSMLRDSRRVDACGCVVMPGFVDSHTHLVFAGWREEEFENRLKGMTYEQIARAGGGILSTVRATREATDESLLTSARKHLQEMLSWGSTSCEIKSGYGLETEAELRLLRIVEQLGKEGPMTVVATFLGAHAVPAELTKRAYIDLVVNQMIPAVARCRLATFCDVFCEDFAFSVEECRLVLSAGKFHGLTPKVHADEVGYSGGAELAAEVGAISAEHLVESSDAGLEAMKRRNVVAVLLPSASFLMQATHTPPIAKMRKLGLTVALGSDFNPGTSTVLAMPIVVSLACAMYGLTPKEALISATINSAKALGLQHRKGSLEPGKDADLLVLDVERYSEIPYRVAHNPVREVMIAGKTVLDRTGRDA